jgi:hypothetical protein
MLMVRSILLVAAVVTSLAGAKCEAQFGFTGAPSTALDSSVRLSGMGHTGVSVTWGYDLNDWANPAVIPYNSGMRYEHSRAQLVPDLRDDVYFTTNRLLWSRWGIGVLLAGRPIDALGGDQVDYGVSEITDQNGNAIGDVRTKEDVNTFALGLSVAQLIENVGLRFGHRLPAVSRFAEASIGHSWKRIEYQQEGAAHGSSEVDTKDRGYLLRVTPYNSIDYPGMIPELENLIRARFDASYGAAEQNYDDNVAYYSGGTALPVIEDHRHGSAFHVAIGLPTTIEENWRAAGIGWLYELVTPLLSYGRTSERSQRYLSGDVAGTEAERTGWEITVANIFSYREGHVEDPTSTIIGDTWGWGVGLRFGDLVGIQYDHATVPQSIFLDEDVDQNGFSIYVNPARAVAKFR